MAVVSEAGDIERDVRTIVGGNFTPHALGSGFTRILERLRAAPIAYLDAFERLFVLRDLDARTLSRLHLPSFLERMRTFSPERVKLLAERLVRKYDTALSIADHAIEQEMDLSEALMPGETSRFVQRLNERRRTLRVLLGQPAGQQ
jgi:hypothetical protein